MRKHVIAFAAATMLLAVVAAPVAGATQPLDVEFEVTVLAERFTASGSAVDAGLMCESGTMANPEPEKFVGKSSVVANAQVITVFTCGEGDFEGDTFVVKHQLHIDAAALPATWTINWVVLDGTGAFAHLRGNGHGTGEILTEPPGGPFDTLEGQLH